MTTISFLPRHTVISWIYIQNWRVTRLLMVKTLSMICFSSVYHCWLPKKCYLHKMDGWVDGWTDGWMEGWMDFFSHRTNTKNKSEGNIDFFFCFTPKPSVTSLYFSPLLLFCKLRIIYVGSLLLAVSPWKRMDLPYEDSVHNFSLRVQEQKRSNTSDPWVQPLHTASNCNYFAFLW